MLKSSSMLFLCLLLSFTMIAKGLSVVSGKATYYASKFEGRRTSNGERYAGSKFTAAHKSLPFGTLIEVTNKRSGKKAIVRVNDRGPHSRSAILDLSYSAAKKLGIVNSGHAKVSVRVLGKKKKHHA